MAFGSSRTQQSQKSERKENFISPFMRLKEGDKIVRILTEEVLYYRYFLTVTYDGKSVYRPVTVGSYNNPIKFFMDSLGEEHPSYRRVQKRYAVNVLDRTLVKKTDVTVTYPGSDGSFPKEDDLGNDISTIEPRVNNQVMILDIGQRLMDMLSHLNDSGFRNPNNSDELLYIQDMDIKVTTKGTGRNTQHFASPVYGAFGKLGKEELPKQVFDLKTMYKPWPDNVLEMITQDKDWKEIMDAMGFEPGDYPMVDLSKYEGTLFPGDEDLF